MQSKHHFAGIALFLIIAGMGLMSYESPKPFQSAQSMAAFYHNPHGLGLLVADSSILFPPALQCAPCHGFDPTQFALHTPDGQDVNMYDDWRSSIMGNSSKDPFWRAKVSQEVLLNPANSVALEDKCTSCHAPAGHFQAKLHDAALSYSFQQAITDTLGLDGVTCQACHAQAPGNNGNLHSGDLNFDVANIRVSYGPYPMSFGSPMLAAVALTPLEGNHINDSGTCAGCHTLLTETVDLQGNPTGTTFTEQATYHEWLNSRYDKEHDNISCQNCHFPRIEAGVKIVQMPSFLDPRTPYGIHEMAGANVAMLNILKDNSAALGISALPEHFDSAIATTRRMLQHKTLDLAFDAVQVTGDSVSIKLKLTNNSGHKFPSGYPSRRAWIELELKTAAGTSIFRSGEMAADGTLPDEDLPFEPHHRTINSPEQVQIYELTPGDVNGQFTTILERGFMALKDNRLVPQGFSINDPVYDTTTIVGSALTDPDFNHFPNGQQGSGSDIVHFNIGLNGYNGLAAITAKVWYQSMPPRWMNPLFADNTPFISDFKTMFDAAENAPVLAR